MRISDWSSDVCSSDLLGERIVTQIQYAPPDFEQDLAAHLGSAFSLTPTLLQSTYFRGHNRAARIEHLYFTGARSAERRVGNECVRTLSTRWAPYTSKTTTHQP